MFNSMHLGPYYSPTGLALNLTRTNSSKQAKYISKVAMNSVTGSCANDANIGLVSNNSYSLTTAISKIKKIIVQTTGTPHLHISSYLVLPNFLNEIQFCAPKIKPYLLIGNAIQTLKMAGVEKVQWLWSNLFVGVLRTNQKHLTTRGSLLYSQTRQNGGKQRVLNEDGFKNLEYSLIFATPMWQIIEVDNERTEAQFLDLPSTLYQGDPNWIAPLVQDVRKVFDLNKNPFFEHGECRRWILVDALSHKTIGRIAAFINRRNAFTEEQPTGGCGFFECIDSREAAFKLFDTARFWLQELGMEAMDGPINFGERNAWWGLLVEGFTPPIYQMNYNPPYYRNLFELYGFKDYFRQLSFSLPVNAQRPERYKLILERLKKSGDYTFKHVEKDKLPKYAEDFRTVYNKTWKFLPNFEEITEQDALKTFETFKPVMIDYLAWFAYHKDEPVAMFLMLPELNGWFKHLKGNLNLWGMLKFLWLKTFDKTNRKIFGIIFGVVPDFQRKGLEAAIVMAADDVVRHKNRWDEIELVWVGDFNLRMLRTCEILGGKVVKTHITYRKLFDETKRFKRHPVIE